MHAELILADREMGQHNEATEKRTDKRGKANRHFSYICKHESKQCISSDNLQRGKTVSWTDSAQRHKVSRTLTRDDGYW